MSDWWFVDPSSSTVHDQGKRELGRSHRPKATGVGSLASGQTWSSGSGLATQTAPCASGHSDLVSESTSLQPTKANQPTREPVVTLSTEHQTSSPALLLRTDQQRPATGVPLTTEQHSSPAAHSDKSNRDMHAAYASLRTARLAELASTAESPEGVCPL